MVHLFSFTWTRPSVELSVLDHHTKIKKLSIKKVQTYKLKILLPCTLSTGDLVAVLGLLWRNSTRNCFVGDAEFRCVGVGDNTT